MHPCWHPRASCTGGYVLDEIRPGQTTSQRGNIQAVPETVSARERRFAAAKPSRLILMALDDLAKAERSRKYRVDMGNWHRPVGKPPRRCAVCLAGSVMAFSLGANPKEHLVPGDMPPDISLRLEALNHFRIGRVSSGLYCMGSDTEVPDCDVPEYHGNKRRFKAALRRIAAKLAKLGL